ncbi:homologous-pairing protein 2 homolog [Microplitis mediator]|uniref:homologous-pairing protein 2 homolog n=1 Tax=Microplitis mediator TaxID=375433 RepID=UPI002555BAFB|nr:homologous-pairing protein 2 homolog [Microplitis mediator]
MTTEAVHKFLESRHRPFNVNDIASNLPEGTKKPAIQQSLDKLVKAGKVLEKTYGKIKIYCIAPDSTKEPHELIRVDRELKAHANELETKFQSLDREIKSREATLATLKATPSLEEAQKEYALIQSRVEQLDRKLNDLMAANNSQDLGEKKKKVQKSYDLYSREYHKRKRLCTDVIDSILEGYPGTKKALYDEIGIDLKIVG